MIRKKFQVVRHDNLLYLTPSIEDKINLKCNIKNFNHTVQKRKKFNANNIIDIRKELIDNKVKGNIHIYIKFIDNSLSRRLNGEETMKIFPDIDDGINECMNPYLIDNVWIASINRYKSSSNKNKFIYKYDNEDGEDQIISRYPILDNLVNYDQYDSYTSSYMYDEYYNSNWIYSGASFNINYKKDLAYEKNYFVTNSISDNGYGFFEIAVRTPNSSSYTPDEAEVIFYIEDEEEQRYNEQ